MHMNHGMGVDKAESFKAEMRRDCFHKYCTERGCLDEPSKHSENMLCVEHQVIEWQQIIDGEDDADNRVDWVTALADFLELEGIMETHCAPAAVPYDATKCAPVFSELWIRRVLGYKEAM